MSIKLSRPSCRIKTIPLRFSLFNMKEDVRFDIQKGDRVLSFLLFYIVQKYRLDRT